MTELIIWILFCWFCWFLSGLIGLMFLELVNIVFCSLKPNREASYELNRRILFWGVGLGPLFFTFMLFEILFMLFEYTMFFSERVLRVLRTGSDN